MDDSLQITYVGHATVLIEIAGVRLLTDPVLRDWVWHLRRQNDSILPEAYQNIDAVLISHMHWDHLDLPSLKLLDKNTRMLVPPGAASLVRGLGFANVRELKAGQGETLGGITVHATYAQHNGARYRFDAAADSLGFLVENHHSVYFAGDTDLFPEMATLADNLDVALLPVWGWGPTLGQGHMDPYRAASALQLLDPRLAIPIHWGTFFPAGLGRFMPSRLTHPPQAFKDYAAQLAGHVKTEIVSPGETIAPLARLA